MIFLKAVLLVLGLSFVAEADTMTALFVISATDSWVGKGRTFFVTPSDNDLVFTVQPWGKSFIQIDVKNTDRWPYPRFPEYYRIELGGPGGEALHVGRYEGTTSWLANTELPYLMYANEGRSAGGRGMFDLLEIEYAPDGSVKSLAVNFIIFTIGLFTPDPQLEAGVFRYNSTVPLFASTPEPSSSVLVSVGIAGVLARGFRRRRQGRGLRMS